MDRIHPLKMESSVSGGTQTDNYPTALNNNEDYIDVRGIVFQNDTSNTETVYINRDVSDNINIYTSAGVITTTNGIQRLEINNAGAFDLDAIGFDLTSTGGNINIETISDASITISATSSTTSNLSLFAGLYLSLNSEEGTYIKYNGTTVFTINANATLNSTGIVDLKRNGTSFLVAGSDGLVTLSSIVGGVSPSGNLALTSLNTMTLSSNAFTLASTKDIDISATDTIFLVSNHTSGTSIKLETTQANADILIKSLHEVSIDTVALDIDATGIVSLNSSYAPATVKNAIIIESTGVLGDLTLQTTNSGALNIKTTGITEEGVILISSTAYHTSKAVDGIKLLTNQNQSHIVLNTTGISSFIKLQANGTTGRVECQATEYVKLYNAVTRYISVNTTGIDIISDLDIDIITSSDGNINLTAPGDTTGDITLTSGGILLLDGSYDTIIDGADNVYIKNAGTTKIEIDSGGIKVTDTFSVSDTTKTNLEYISTLTNSKGLSLCVKHNTNQNMVDGFGSGLYFSIEDSANVNNNIATIFAIRSGADNSGALKFETYNNANPGTRLYIDKEGKIATGGETSPDTDPGGLCLYHGSNDGKALTFKNSDVNHGMTTIAETDTYCLIKKYITTSGGVNISGITSSEVGLFLIGYGTTGVTTNISSSKAGIMVVASKKSGTSSGAFLSTENVVGWRNHANTIMILKGDGELYNDYATSMTTFDDYNDIDLARNTQLALSGIEREKLNKQTIKQLSDLGIINKEGFGSMQQINAITLGAITQLGNVIKIMAKELGWSKNKLMKVLKTYE